jgi:hypothetical protein
MAVIADSVKFTLPAPLNFDIQSIMVFGLEEALIVKWKLVS